VHVTRHIVCVCVCAGVGSMTLTMEGATAGDIESPLVIGTPSLKKISACLKDPVKQAIDTELHASLTWWFRALCFCYSAVGINMLWRMHTVSCHCPSYHWQVEAWLLVLQGVLSFLHDAYFAGSSTTAGRADRCCATLLTLCQPLKLSFCTMDVMQLWLLVAFWTIGLMCFFAAKRAFGKGNIQSYQVFHSMWHVALPLGGCMWIEYTHLLLTGSLQQVAWQDATVLPSAGLACR